MAVQHDGFLRHHLETERIIGVGRDVEGLRADGVSSRCIFPWVMSISRARSPLSALCDLSRQPPEASARSQRMDAIGQMTGGIAHDFNNLDGVIGNLELLEMSETSAKAAR